MRKKLLISGFLFWIISVTSFAQIIEVNNFPFQLLTTDISPNDAIRKTIKEALSACIQQKMGVSVIDLTNFQRTETNSTYKEYFNNFMMQFSLGYVSGYEIIDTIQNLQSGGVIETTIKMNIRLRQPQSEDPFGLYAKTNASFFHNQDQLFMEYSVKKPGYIYIFDMTWKDEVGLLVESQEKIEQNRKYIFPPETWPFKLVMEKEAKNDFEFGCMIILISRTPLNFGIKPLGSHPGANSFISIREFFEIINVMHGEYSIKYIPYCIE
ncbi:MAG: DUF4384 domain-containing protein [Lentimicrobiaceae bacterium]|jgi:hypothetical protein|nr:DUF4384 domain-containing protein [Lentimicrobiaceae bacterium]